MDVSSQTLQRASSIFRSATQKQVSIRWRGKPTEFERTSLQNSQPSKLIEKALRSKSPKTIAELAQAVRDESALDDVEFVKTVKAMAKDGTLVLQEPIYQVDSALDYLFTPTLSMWLWLALGLTILAIIAVLSVPDLFPFNIFRWVLGSIFVLYLPGYAFLQCLFPKSSEIDNLERFALNVGVSLALVPLIGLLLNFTPWGIRLPSVTASLGAFTVVFALSAAARKYLDIKKLALSG